MKRGNIDPSTNTLHPFQLDSSNELQERLWEFDSRAMSHGCSYRNAQATGCLTLALHFA